MSDNSKMVPDRAIFTTVDQWKVIYGLLNGAIFNDLEWPQTQFLRPHYSLMLSLKQYCLKLSCNYNNPAYAAVFNSNFHSVFERKPITYYYYQLPPLAIRVSGDLQAVGFKKSDVITSSIPTTPPWLLTRPAVNFTLHCSDKSSTPEIFKHRFYELCHEFKNYYHIFTDGSKEGNRVAAAVVHRDNTKCVRLPDTASIFRAELYALLLAIDVVRCSKEKNFVIFSDFMSSLQSIYGFKLDSDLVQKFLKDYTILSKKWQKHYSLLVLKSCGNPR